MNDTQPKFLTMDGNEAVSHIAYRTNEVIAIYPITPSSPMGEWCDEWAAQSIPNIWGSVPSVIEMQSEGGAAGAIHGALQTGSLATTFTASQGLLLMIPNMYKIAGELTSTVFHIAARSLATHALSIFGDHSDVMGIRPTGWAMLCSNTPQEAHDFALIAQAATLESRVPLLHFFDGFRTSHEVSKVKILTDNDIRTMIDEELVLAHRSRGLTPDRPVLRGTAQNPDVFFQAREACNPFYAAVPDLVQKAMDKFAALTGRDYKLYEYYGAPDADRVIVMMGSGCETAQETIDALPQKLGLLKVRLYRPFDAKTFVAALPATVKTIAVLDRTKEPGAIGEPLYQDVVTALAEHGRQIKVLGGRYGLSSKEFTPAMAKAVFENETKNHFTVGINDDISQTSLAYDPDFSTEPDSVVRAVFYGLGADGTVGANKNSIKIIGENTPNYAQGYFVYDSKKSGSMTVSHLRFGPQPIHSTYLITKANFIACHHPQFLDKFDMLADAAPGGVFLLNTPHGPHEIWDRLPRVYQQRIIEKQLRFCVIDAPKAGRINTAMQVCFFAISGVLPREQAIAEIKNAIKKTYGKKGDEIVQMNLRAVDLALEFLHEVEVPAAATSTRELATPLIGGMIEELIAGRGDLLPVSQLPCDGTFPLGTARYEKRNIALEIPVWEPAICIQCNKCVMVCPHGVIRAKVYDAETPLKFAEAKDRDWKGLRYSIQVSTQDCTGCALCVDVCPARDKSEPKLKAINMSPRRNGHDKDWGTFLDIPDMDRRQLKLTSIPQQQLQQPLFEFSGACAGCGETPYLKLISQLFGDRMIVANATGCSSIYGGNLPTTPWTTNSDGRGPAWSNSLFEDNAEFGLGFRLSIDKQREYAGELLRRVAPEMADGILTASQRSETDLYEQRERVEALKEKLKGMKTLEARALFAVADMLVRKSVWIVGGDGWAYDIGFGGLDHVLASGRDVNILVLDTEVYSNTGGQMSKATPRGAVAKFAAGGKPLGKKDLGLLAMSYGHVYVASVAMGARDEHTLRAFLEAESYDGPSLIIAYSHCIAHGINMSTAMQNQKAAVNSGQWLLYRYDPRREGNPLQLDSRAPKQKVEEFLMMENRFKMLTKSNPARAKELFRQVQADADRRFEFYEFLAARKEWNGSEDHIHGPDIAKPTGGVSKPAVVG
jgi:pyruvate-ferredoxin/flavodoxin oxidoreductase